jgi:hypothetical protein
MRDLADTLVDLKVRLKVALAGELAQHVAKAVGDVVGTLVVGRAEFAHGRPPPKEWGEHDPWEDGGETDPQFGRYASRDEEEEMTVNLSAKAATPIALAAAIHVARWWLGRRGHLLGALGLGFGVGIVGLTGGAIIRSALAALTAAADLLAVTDALDNSAARLQSP